MKRFNCVNNKWVKSQKVVHFPFDNFDPTPYLAAVPQETILRHKELLEMNDISQTLKGISEKDDDKALETQNPKRNTNSPNNGNTTNTNTTTTTALNTTNSKTAAPNVPHKPLNGLTTEAQISLNDQVNNLLNLNSHHHTSSPSPQASQILDDCSNIVENNSTTGAEALNKNSNPNTNDNLQQISDDNDDESSDKMLDNNPIMRQNEGDRTMTRRKRLISTSLTKTPIIDGEFEDYHQHKLKSGEDKFDPKYKLYAVVVSRNFKVY